MSNYNKSIVILLALIANINISNANPLKNILNISAAKTDENYIRSQVIRGYLNKISNKNINKIESKFYVSEDTVRDLARYSKGWDSNKIEYIITKALNFKPAYKRSSNFKNYKDKLYNLIFRKYSTLEISLLQAFQDQKKLDQAGLSTFDKLKEDAKDLIDHRYTKPIVATTVIGLATGYALFKWLKPNNSLPKNKNVFHNKFDNLNGTEFKNLSEIPPRTPRGKDQDSYMKPTNSEVLDQNKVDTNIPAAPVLDITQLGKLRRTDKSSELPQETKATSVNASEKAAPSSPKVATMPSLDQNQLNNLRGTLKKPVNRPALQTVQPEAIAKLNNLKSANSQYKVESVQTTEDVSQAASSSTPVNTPIEIKEVTPTTIVESPIVAEIQKEAPSVSAITYDDNNLANHPLAGKAQEVDLSMSRTEEWEELTQHQELEQKKLEQLKAQTIANKASENNVSNATAASSSPSYNGDNRNNQPVVMLTQSTMRGVAKRRHAMSDSILEPIKEDDDWEIPYQSPFLGSHKK